MDHVIIGAGPAGVIAAETLRCHDPTGQVTLISDEGEPPYSRMALPYLLAGDIDEAGTHLRHAVGHWENMGIGHRRDRVERVDAGGREIALEGGGRLNYDRLLIATGSHAALPQIPGINLPGVETCWTLADGRAIGAGAKRGSRVVLIGAGFIGCIMLGALAKRGANLTIIETEERMLPRMMDGTGAGILKYWCESRGVRVFTATRVERIESDGATLKLLLQNGKSILADQVICATGVKPNIGFLEGTGVATDQGVLVNNRLETSVDGIYAAGDVAQGPEFFTGAREIHAIQPTASEHGRIAGLNMSGQSAWYAGSLSMNVLDTFGLVSSSFGQWMGVDGGEESVHADPERFRYIRLNFDDDRLVGALTLGFTPHVGVIRGLMQTRLRLGKWKDRLIRNPTQVMEAYLARMQGSTAGVPEDA